MIFIILYQNIIMILTFCPVYSALGFRFVHYFLPSVLWIFAIIDILKSNFKDSTNKIIWFNCTFVARLGSILYFIFGETKTN